MDKSEIKILVVEDDASFGRSIVELIKRAGYDAVLTPNPEHAVTLSEQQDFQVLIIDCMLPKLNGVDLAQDLMARIDPPPALFLMTGIFKDKNFMKEALRKTHAITLLHKPFHLEKLLSLVENEIKKTLDPELEPLPDLLTRSECSSADILAAFQKQASFHAYHLPLVLSLFAREGMTGEINVVSSEREVSQITLIEGRIVDVRSQNTSTQLGELLVEFGFVMPEDVEEALAQTNPGAPLGVRLVQAGALSPHAVGLIREEQLAIRLSQLIQNTSIEISWLKKKIEMRDTFHPLPPSRLKMLMSEWILSKIPADWLRSSYLPFSERLIGWRGKAAVKIEGAKANMPLLAKVIERVSSAVTLQDLLVEAGENELQCLQAVHTLVLERKIYFGEKRRSANDFQAKINRYARLLQSFSTKDLFQILGVSQKARASEVHRSYTELAKQFHPDKVPPEAPQELKDLCHKIFAQITNAHSTLSDETRRSIYLDELSRKEANRVFELEPVFERAIKHLKAQKYSKAIREFKELIALKAPMPDLLAYLYWAKLKAGKKIPERDFYEIPPEHRHSAVYLVARGLHHKSLGHFQKALECFQHARLMDSQMSEAQKEIVELIDEVGTNESTINNFFFRILGKKDKKSA